MNRNAMEPGSPSPLAVSLQLAGAAFILVGAFTPWVRSQVLFLDIPVKGVSTDYGRLFPFLALAVCALLAYEWSFGWRRWAAKLVFLVGIVGLSVAVTYAVQVTHRVARLDEEAKRRQQAPFVVPGSPVFSVSFDAGYYVTLLGAGSIMVGAAVSLLRKPST